MIETVPLVHSPAIGANFLILLHLRSKCKQIATFIFCADFGTWRVVMYVVFVSLNNYFDMVVMQLHHTVLT